MPVVVQPHDTFWLEAEQSSEESTNKGDETSERRNTTGDAVCDDGSNGGASDPGRPMDDAVGCQVLGSSEESNEYVLGGDLSAISKCYSNIRLQVRDLREGTGS